MKDILTAPFLIEMIRTASNMYSQGWDERNGGNISLMLDECDITPYLDTKCVLRRIPIGFHADELIGQYFLVTGTGKYFKNVQYAPERDLGLLRIGQDGCTAELLWGFSDGGSFTSELPAHLMSHTQRMRVCPKNRVVMHCHPNNLLAMTYIHPLDERAFTHTLWQMCTECVMVFPDGVNVLPWMLCGTTEIGQATAEKMQTARLVVWAQHGVYGAGNSLDEAFGLIETAEKAAAIYLKIAHLPILNTITDDQMRQTAQHLHLTLRPGFLD
jgi:rhamnulose-1-phosphate aldolase